MINTTVLMSTVTLGAAYVSFVNDNNPHAMLAFVIGLTGAAICHTLRNMEISVVLIPPDEAADAEFVQEEDEEQ